jgi:hypothetical protein
VQGISAFGWSCGQQIVLKNLLVKTPTKGEQKNQLSFLTKKMKKMKTKKILVYACMLVACIGVTKKTLAQQPVHSKLSVLQPLRPGQPASNLTAKVFMAPDKSYGYDISSNGKLIYHQPPLSKTPRDNDVSITKKEQANTAAMISIEKIKSGKNPQLSNEELQKIIAH